jgi:hypothetical protein
VTDILERRYARLLRLYPADYRRARGAELLETLWESAEHPLAGPPRIRRPDRDRARRLCRRRGDAWPVRPRHGDGGSRFPHGPGRELPDERASSGVFWQVPLAIVFLLPLLRRPPVVVSGLLRYLPVVPLVLVALELAAAVVGPSFAPFQIGALVVLSAAGLAWLAVDERVAMVLGLLLINGVLVQVASAIETNTAQQPAQMIAAATLAAVAPAVLLGFGVSTARRQARL